MKSTARKKLAGTLRASRQRRGLNDATALTALPVPPHLTESATAAWQRFGALSLELGTLTQQDLPLLELLARTWAGICSLEAQLARDGLVIESDSGARKAHPALQALDRARGHAHRMLGDLGLTPVGREKISVQPRRGSNRFSEL
jgi:P27 family predicted phage terminase small subunit